MTRQDEARIPAEILSSLFELESQLSDLGALMIEDQFLVTASGAECMNSLPRTLRDLSAN